MKIKQVRALGAAELSKELRTLREEAYSLRFQRASGNLQNTSRPGAVRRAIARLLTVQGERARGDAAGGVRS